MICFNPRALTSPDKDPDAETPPPSGFNPRALTSPDAGIFGNKGQLYVSIRGLLRALTKKHFNLQSHLCFNPRALTSPDYQTAASLKPEDVSIRGLLRALTSDHGFFYLHQRFQSAGSYEP